MACALAVAACGRSSVTSVNVPPWEADSPIRPIAAAPFGMDLYLAGAPRKPTPERVRLGRWLFFDARLSADNTISCATCHRPEYAFSQPTPVPIGPDDEVSAIVEFVHALEGEGYQDVAPSAFPQ